MRLFGLYERVFSAGLAVRDAILRGANRSRLVDEVQREVNALLDAVESEARAAGRRDADIREASFAAVAWLDEVIAGDPEWFGFDVQPLQVLRFNTFQAGEEFYQRLRDLRAEQDEVREIFYVALSLGFLGRYALDPDSPDWRAIMASQARQVPVAPVNPVATPEEKVTPQAYAVPLPTARRLPSQSGRLLMRVAVTLAVVVPLGVYLYLWLAGGPSSPDEPSAPAVADESSDPPGDVTAGVNAAVAAETCAGLKAVVSNGRDVTLSGFDNSEESLRTLRAKLLAMEGVGAVDVTGVQIIPKPLCEVAQVVSRHSVDGGLRLALRGGALAAGLGATIAVEAQATQAFPAYVHIDIFSPDGSVGHIRPDGNSAFKAAAPGATVTAGDGDPMTGAVQWVVEPPGGPHLLVAMSTRTPLFPKPRPMGEDTREYLTALEAALAAMPADAAVMRYVLLRLGE